jgi:ATP-binding cassette subfamily F protein 3
VEATKSEPQKRSNPLAVKKKIDELSDLMAKIERLIQGIDTELSDPAIYAKNPNRAADLTKARANAAEKLARTEEEWLELTTEYEDSLAS